jgi:murein L,D-transpeptidase YcbB/YkuD
MANYQLLWLGHEHSAQQIAEVIELLNNASVNGLNAGDYDVQWLRQKQQAALASGGSAPKEAVLYDTALSLSLLRFLHDVHYGRVIPQEINFKLKLREKKLIDLPQLIKNSLTQENIASLPALVEPKLQQYQKLKTVLSGYRQLAGQSTPLKLVIDKSLRPDDVFPQAQALRQFLMASGDLPKDTQNPNIMPMRYTDDLVDGVKKYQTRHGMNADGIIGKSTAVKFKEPLNQRILQIELAMERLRWLPEFSNGPSIIVNIPAFQLWAFDDINVINPDISGMRVVVGKALENQTPVLMAEMSFIDFMPYWNVPYNIVKNEILPKLIKNPRYLAQENMEMVSKSRVVTFNQGTIEQLKQGTVRIRQRPGKKNALGKVKFIFPNKEDVYLHDTPSRTLFRKSRRDLSHGCVRVADPKGLAEFALKNQWSKQTIENALNTPKNQRVFLKKSIPVLFFYTTAFFDHENKLVFYPDIYGQDAVLIDALKKTEDLSDQAIFTPPPEPVPEPMPLDNVSPPEEIGKPIAVVEPPIT